MSFSALLIVSKIVWKESFPFHNNRTLVAKENSCLKIPSTDKIVNPLSIPIRPHLKFYVNSNHLGRGSKIEMDKFCPHTIINIVQSFLPMIREPPEI